MTQLLFLHQRKINNNCNRYSLLNVKCERSSPHMPSMEDLINWNKRKYM